MGLLVGPVAHPLLPQRVLPLVVVVAEALILALATGSTDA